MGFIGKHLEINLMSDSTMEVGKVGKPLLEGKHKTKRRKCIKKKSESISINLNFKTRLSNVMEPEEMVVSRFPGKKMSYEYFKGLEKVKF
jgi:hypothetical protein